MENQLYMKTNQPLPKHVETTYKRHGRDFYKRIGHIGGHNSHKGGFQEGSDLAKEAGRKGGLKSRRTFHYNYAYTQTFNLTEKNLISFTQENQKYKNFYDECKSQKRFHTAHTLASLPTNVNVPIFYETEEGFTYVFLSVKGKIKDPFKWNKIIKTMNQHVSMKYWAEYYRGYKIIKKEKL